MGSDIFSSLNGGTYASIFGLHDIHRSIISTDISTSIAELGLFSEPNFGYSGWEALNRSNVMIVNVDNVHWTVVMREHLSSDMGNMTAFLVFDTDWLGYDVTVRDKIKPLIDRGFFDHL